MRRVVEAAATAMLCAVLLLASPVILWFLAEPPDWESDYYHRL